MSDALTACTRGPPREKGKDVGDLYDSIPVEVPFSIRREKVTQIPIDVRHIHNAASIKIKSATSTSRRNSELQHIGDGIRSSIFKRNNVAVFIKGKLFEEHCAAGFAIYLNMHSQVINVLARMYIQHSKLNRPISDGHKRSILSAA